MVSTSLLAGGTLYVGYKTYCGMTGEAKPAWWQALMTRFRKRRRQVVEERELSTIDLLTSDCAVDHQLAVTDTASLVAAFERFAPPTAEQSLVVALSALGTTMAGTLLYPPLRLVCIPAFLYLGIAPTQTAYVSWRQARRVSPAVAESVVLVLCLVQGHFLVGAVGFSLYYLGQVVAEAKRKAQELQTANELPLWAWRQSAEGEVVTLVSRLQIGDTIVVHAGEMTPLAGVVIRGVAWVRTRASARCAADDACSIDMKVAAGQLVKAATIVLVGSLQLSVIAVT